MRIHLFLMICGTSLFTHVVFAGPLDGKLAGVADKFGTYIHNYQTHLEADPVGTQYDTAALMVLLKGGVGFSVGGPIGAGAGVVKGLFDEAGSFITGKVLSAVGGDTPEKFVQKSIEHFAPIFTSLDSKLTREQAIYLAVGAGIIGLKSADVGHVVKGIQELDLMKFDLAGGLMANTADALLAKKKESEQSEQKKPRQLVSLSKVLETIEAGDVGHLEIQLKINEEMGVDNHIFLNQLGPKGRTPLHVACVCDNYAMARLLLAYGADAKMKTKDGMTALFFTCIDQDLAITQLLIDSGIDVNAQRPGGDTVLHNILAEIAACKKDPTTETVRLLLKHGANPNLQVKGYTALDFVLGAFDAKGIDISRIGGLLLDAGGQTNKYEPIQSQGSCSGYIVRLNGHLYRSRF